MVSTLFLVLYLNLHSAHCSQYEEFVAATLPSLCPYTRLCTKGPNKTFKSKNSSPCCKPCSCERNCLSSGNCRPDFPAATSSASLILPTAKCLMPIHYEYDQFNRKANAKETFHFFLSSSCPATCTDEEVVRKCTNPQTLEIKDRVIVADDSGRAFSNRYCAQCNNIHTYTAWNLQLICMIYSQQLLDIRNFKALNENACVVQSTPPKTAVLVPRCYSAEYKECNLTGRWDVYDPLLEQACKRTAIPYFHETLYSTTVYTNAYCYLCNHQHGTETDKLCLFDGNDDRQETFTTFNSILDLTAADPEISVGQNNLCKLTEVQDYHFGKCRPLHCPADLVPQWEKCIKIFKTTTGLPIFVEIDAIYANRNTQAFFNQTLPRFQIKQYMEAIATHLAADIGIRAHSCGICQSQVLIRNDQSGLTFLLQFKTNTTCSASSIIDLVNKWRTRKRNMSLKIKEQKFNFILNIGYDLSGFVFGEDKRFKTEVMVLGDSGKCPPSTFSLKPNFYCPSVDIPINDYKKYVKSANGQKHVSDFTEIGNINTAPGNASIIHYRICIDIYLPKENTAVQVGLLSPTAYIILPFSARLLAIY